MVGDIVIVRFPYTDLSNARIRPGLLVADVRHDQQPDWVVCRITTQSLPGSGQIALEPNDLVVGQLAQDSWVRPDRIMTMNEQIFRNTVARLTDAKLAEILAAVRSLF